MHEELSRKDLDLILQVLIPHLHVEDEYATTIEVFRKVYRLSEERREAWKREAKRKVMLRKLLHVLPGGA